MGFHEVQFPTDISYGSRGGPGFSTTIITVDSGSEERISRWANARRRYDVAYGIRSLAQLSILTEFYVGRKGAAFGFRYKDFLDFTTASDHQSAPAFGDHNIGTGDAALGTFQIIKRYVSGPSVRVRNLRKPVSGTVVVGWDGVQKGTGWTVDTATGIITFSPVPGAGVIISAGCEFDVPVRFDESADDQLELTIEHFDDGSSSIPLVEILGGEIVKDEFLYDGASDITIASNMSLGFHRGRVQRIAATAAGLDVFLPAETALSAGGPQFYLFNPGLNDWNLKTASGLLVKVMVATTGTAIVLMGDDGTNKSWIVL